VELVSLYKEYMVWCYFLGYCEGYFIMIFFSLISSNIAFPELEAFSNEATSKGLFLEPLTLGELE